MEIKNVLNAKPPILVNEPDDLYSIPEQVHVGDVVKVQAVDWAIHEGQVSRHLPFAPVRGTNYGEVIAVDADGLTIAPQVFTDGQVRYPLTMPLVTIELVEILARAE